MQEQHIRTAMLLGEDGLQRLQSAHVLVFGLGGVGGHAAEALARAGVGALTLVDKDTVSLSNLNRQLVALRSTVGQSKAAALQRRIADIDPACRVTALEMFYLPENADSLPFTGYDYIIDAVDSVSAKLEIVTRAAAAGIPVISCMGTGNKLHPELLRIGDIAATHTCPLARVMRRELKARGIAHTQVLWSSEQPLTSRIPAAPEGPGGRTPPGSVSFVPSAAGLMIAGHVVRALAAAE